MWTELLIARGETMPVDAVGRALLLPVVMACNVVLLACDRSTPVSPSPAPPGTSGPAVYTRVPAGGRFADGAGDSTFDFVDLSSMSLDITDLTVTVGITVVRLPSVLSYNHPNLSINAQEYRWAVSFDVDGDGQRTGDIQLGLYRFKAPGSQPASASPLGFGQASAFRVNSNGGGSLIATIGASVTGNTIVLTADKRSHADLRLITPDKALFFDAFHSDGDTASADYHPDR
jgi:hypothetical protein